MPGLGFAGGDDFVDRIFNRYTEKTRKIAQPERDLQNLLAQVDINTTDFWRNIEAQRRMNELQLDKAKYYYGNIGDMQQINEYGAESGAQIFGGGLGVELAPTKQPRSRNGVSAALHAATNANVGSLT